MRKTLLLPAFLCAACSLTPTVARGEDIRPPRIDITNVVKKEVNGRGYFRFTVLATDNQKVARLEHRLTLDGNRGSWKRTPYDESPEKLAFTVQASTLKFEVRAVDVAHNKSKILSRVMTRAS